MFLSISLQLSLKRLVISNGTCQRTDTKVSKEANSFLTPITDPCSGSLIPVECQLTLKWSPMFISGTSCSYKLNVKLDQRAQWVALAEWLKCKIRKY